MKLKKPKKIIQKNQWISRRFKHLRSSINLNTQFPTTMVHSQIDINHPMMRVSENEYLLKFKLDTHRVTPNDCCFICTIDISKSMNSPPPLILNLRTWKHQNSADGIQVPKKKKKKKKKISFKIFNIMIWSFISKTNGDTTSVVKSVSIAAVIE